MNIAENLPLIVIEGVLVFGGTLAFGWWQLSDIRRERHRREAHRRIAVSDAPAIEGAVTSDATVVPGADPGQSSVNQN
jgi:hypothetical protein